MAEPKVFIGLLFGGVVPWLFSSMLIRAVGRAAFYIIKECRIQFRDQDIWRARRSPITPASSISAPTPPRAS